MKRDYNKYIGKRMTWKKIQEVLPDKWIALDEYEFDDHTQLKSGVIMAVCADNEVIELEKQMSREYPKLYWKRTAGIMEVTFIW